MILPAITLDYAKYYKPAFTVVENDSKAQIVSSRNKKMDMFVIYTPLQLSIEGLGVISFDQAGLYMLEQKNKTWFMTTADLTHKLNRLTFTLNGKKIKWNFLKTRI